MFSTPLSGKKVESGVWLCNGTMTMKMTDSEALVVFDDRTAATDRSCQLATDMGLTMSE